MMTPDEIAFCNGRAAGKAKPVPVIPTNFEEINRLCQGGIPADKIAIFLGKPGLGSPMRKVVNFKDESIR